MIVGDSIIIPSDIKAEATDLLQYAAMGASYARNGLGLMRPRVGLLNVGTEEHKGRAELKVYAERLRTRLLGVEDAAKVALIGDVEEKIFVEISHHRLATLGQITAGLGHEIRQPLAAMRVYAESGERLLAADRLANVPSGVRFHLDAALRMDMRMEIGKLHQQLGATMIYVTHDQVEAMTLGQRIVVLKDGIIQQIDTPMALYDRPANLFVAGFLGSPAMNVLRGTLQGDASGVTVVDGDWRAPLGQATIDPAWLQKPIAVGVRPEHLQPASADDALAFTARIEGIEPVGNEIFVNMSSGQHALTMRVAPQSLPDVGEDIRVAIHPQGLHFFDAETGERLNDA